MVVVEVLDSLQQCLTSRSQFVLWISPTRNLDRRIETKLVNTDILNSFNNTFVSSSLKKRGGVSGGHAVSARRDRSPLQCVKS